ncbi:MAG: TatD family hydrolase [Patescibacteria group bacterium]
MNPLLIDIHSHVNFAAFKEDGDAVIARALEKGILVMNVGSQINTSHRAVEIAVKYQEGVYAIVGLHPIHLEEMEVDEEEHHFTTRAEEFNYKTYLELARHPKVVAIGECGLDYYRIDADQRGLSRGSTQNVVERQRETLIQHIALANELRKPLMIHLRAGKDDPDGAYMDLAEIIRVHPLDAGGDVHCFSGSKAAARALLDLGLYLSFTGIITFKNAHDARELVRYVPLEHLMVETDAPYLAPDPFRGKRNEPQFVEFVARKVAEVKGLSFEQVAEATTGNAMRLFQLK